MHRVSNSIVIGLVGISAAVFASGASGQQIGGNPDAKKVKNPAAATPASIAAGQQLYQKYCKFCHGDGAKGDGKMAPKDSHPSDLTDAKWDRGSTDGEVFLVLRDGAGPELKMKGYKGRMSETDMWNVINYLRSVGPKK